MGKPKLAGVSRRLPATPPVVTPLGLPHKDLVPQIPPPPSLESVTPDPDTTSESWVTPVTQPPAIDITTLANLATADVTDDEYPIDPRGITHHETFYLEDGNVEVLCGKTLFRVHTTVLSFHSPVLRRTFAQTSLAAAELPNDCPRFLSSDTTEDFSMLLKMIYLPGSGVPPTYC